MKDKWRDFFFCKIPPYCRENPFSIQTDRRTERALQGNVNLPQSGNGYIYIRVRHNDRLHVRDERLQLLHKILCLSS